MSRHWRPVAFGQWGTPLVYVIDWKLRMCQGVLRFVMVGVPLLAANCGQDHSFPAAPTVASHNFRLRSKQRGPSRERHHVESQPVAVNHAG
jgi:hypothetical protein